MKISFIIPAYNEEMTIGEMVKKLINLSFSRLVPNVVISPQIIVIDDGSDDGTAMVIRRVMRKVDPGGQVIKFIKHDHNYGKGRAIRSGLSHVIGDIVIIQDADLEYDPAKNLSTLLAPFFDERKADVVYGSRFLAPSSLRPIYFWHLMGNHFLTFLTNLCTGLILTDMETGYKVFRRSVAVELLPVLKADDFRIEPEFTIKVAHRCYRLFEVPITYNSRTYKDGKKIGWIDGIRALGAIIGCSIWDR